MRGSRSSAICASNKRLIGTIPTLPQRTRKDGARPGKLRMGWGLFFLYFATLKSVHGYAFISRCSAFCQS